MQDPAQLALTAFQLAAECHVGHAYPRKAYEDRQCGNCNRPGIAGTAYPPQSVAPAAGSPPHALVVPMPSGLGQLGCDCVAQQQLQQRCGPVAARGPASAAQLHALQLAPAAGPARVAQLMPQQYRCILGFSHSAAQPGRVAGATAQAAVRPLRLCCQHGAGRAPPPPPPSLSGDTPSGSRRAACCPGRAQLWWLATNTRQAWREAQAAIVDRRVASHRIVSEEAEGGIISQSQASAGRPLPPFCTSSTRISL